MSRDAPFAALATSACPPLDAMLLAVEAEFQPVDRVAIAAWLDELARPLFGVAGAAPDDRLIAIARTAWNALPEDDDDAAAWLLGPALGTGRASGALRAALAAELGRRAGVRTCVGRRRGCWALQAPEHPVAADMGADDVDAVPVAAMCAHQLAFAVLTGVADAWRADRDVPRAQRAAGLRLLLPLDAGLRERVRQDVRGYGGAA